MFQKAKDGEVDAELSELYMNASRRSRDAIAEEFNLQTTLYFSYTHLVCRTAKEGATYTPYTLHSVLKVEHSHSIPCSFPTKNFTICTFLFLGLLFSLVYVLYNAHVFPYHLPSFALCVVCVSSC